VAARHRFVIQSTAEGFGAGYIVSFKQGTGRRHERDPAAARESGRTNERF